MHTAEAVTIIVRSGNITDCWAFGKCFIYLYITEGDTNTRRHKGTIYSVLHSDQEENRYHKIVVPSKMLALIGVVYDF